MKWRVEGADLKTGEDFTLEIEADDEASARRRAARRGMAVATARARPLQPPVAYHEQSKRASGLGIASLILGIVACLFSLIPGCGIIPAIMFAAIGGILGLVGLLAGASDGRTGSGFPIAGMLTCVLAVLIGVAWWIVIGTGATVAAQGIADAVKEAEARDAQRQAQQVPQTARDTGTVTRPRERRQPAPKPIVEASVLAGASESTLEALFWAKGKRDGDDIDFPLPNEGFVTVRMFNGRAGAATFNFGSPYPADSAAALRLLGVNESDLSVTARTPAIKRYAGTSNGAKLRAASATFDANGCSLVVLQFEGFPPLF